MMDMGYGSDDPALMLTHWKFYLRSVTNAIIDAKIHTAGMTESEAVALMVDGGFQEDSEARAKVTSDGGASILERMRGYFRL